jgi:hypothetical protein
MRRAKVIIHKGVDSDAMAIVGDGAEEAIL